MYTQQNIDVLRNKAACLSHALQYDFLQDADDLLSQAYRYKQASIRYKYAGGKWKGVGDFVKNTAHKAKNLWKTDARAVPAKIKPYTIKTFYGPHGTFHLEETPEKVISKARTIPGKPGILQRGLRDQLAQTKKNLNTPWIAGSAAGLGGGAAGYGLGGSGKEDMQNKIDSLQQGNTSLAKMLAMRSMQNRDGSPGWVEYLKDPRTMGLLGGGGLLALLALMNRGS